MAGSRKKVAIYCRLSEEDRDKKSSLDDSESIQNQKSMLIQYAMEQSWDIYAIYSDDNYTGADRNRPQFNKLLEDAMQHKFDIILCKSQSRFTREMELVEKYIHGLFLEWRIRFVSIADHADTEIRGNKKSRQINGLVNEWMLEDTSENIKKVFDDKRKRGLHIGAFALYGYRKDPDQKGHLIVDGEAAEVVREIFSLFAGGTGKTAIARILNDRGIPNPTEYKRLHGMRYRQPVKKQSTLWKYYTISDMLINEQYIGNMVQGKYGSISYKTKINKPRPKEQWIRVEGTHEPIISRELWDTVQELIAGKSKPFSVGEIGVFARKTRCMNCGYIMRQTKTREYRYLQCTTRFVSKDSCTGAFIPQRLLEEVVLEELKLLIAQYLDMESAQSKLQLGRRQQEKRKKLEKELQFYEEKREEVNKALKMLYLDKVRGILTDQEYGNFAAAFRDDLQKYEQSIQERQKLALRLSEREQHEVSGRELLEGYRHMQSLSREMVENLIDYIEVGRKSEKGGKTPVRIHWKF